MLISTLNIVIKQQTYCLENELNKTLLSTKVLNGSVWWTLANGHSDDDGLDDGVGDIG